MLKNEMREGVPSHAYLFVGSRGTGKTSCAKLVAKAVNCLDLHDGNPCGECEICRGVDNGSLLDVVEIDAASNNGVDNIRDLRDEAVFTPAVAKYRVYIIDEVHMLSVNAFNALLKILEEPPEHVIFVLATTEIHKVLPTIISRCQRFDFQRIESPVIAARIKEVAACEEFKITDDAAALIARLSDGGMRDALSLLDVCVANSENITLETVKEAVGLVGSDHLFELCEGVLAGDTGAVLQKLSQLSKRGMEPQRLLEQLCGHLRNIMLAKTVDKPDALLGCLPSEIDALREQAKKISLNDLLYDMTVLQDTITRMSKSAMKRAELELALVTLCEPTARSGYQALLSRIEKLESAMRKGEFAAAAPAAPSPVISAEPHTEPEAAFVPPQAVKAATPAPMVAAPEPKAPKAAAASDSIPTAYEQPLQPQESDTQAQAAPYAKWPQVLECLSKINMGNYAMLRNTKAYFNGRQVLIDVSDPIVLDMLRNNEYTKNNIKQAVLEATGERVGLGPYRPSRQEDTPQVDPFQKLIEELPKNDNIVIE